MIVGQARRLSFGKFDRPAEFCSDPITLWNGMKMMSSRLPRVLSATLALSFLAFAGVGAADDNVHPEVSSRFNIDLGIFFPERKTRLGAGLNVGDDRGIDFSDEFGLDKQYETFALDFSWRFGEKWSVSAQYFETSGKSESVLEEDVDWNGLVFQAGSSVEASTGFTLYRTLVGRSFGNDERTDFGVGIGLHWLELKAALAGNVLISGDASQGVVFTEEAVAASAPLPNIGAWYKYSLSPRWALRARVDWFSAAVDEYDGTLLNWQVGANFNLTPHIGLGVAYNAFHLDVGVDSSKWYGTAELDYEGPFAFVSIYW